MARRDNIDEERLEAFIESVPGWDDLEQQKIDWMMYFFHTEVGQRSVDSREVEDAFRLAKEPVPTSVFKYWRDKLDKTYIPIAGGYSLTGKRIRELKRLREQGHLAGTGSMVWFVEGGRPYTDQKRLAAVLETLRGEVCVCDPYFGPRVLIAIEHLRQCESVRCLNRDFGHGGKVTAVQRVRDFKSEHSNVEFRFLESGALHDRYLLDDNRLLLLGHGLKDFGRKETFVVILDQQFAEDTMKTVKDTFDTHWTAARPLG